MQKMKCSVCSYIHEGDTAPEKCPVCGVGSDKFVAVAEEKSWKCSVCSHLHTGATAPDKCPVCSVGADKFVLENQKTVENSWKCTICSYVHKGDVAPEVCPVCKASSDKFVLVGDKAKDDGELAGDTSEPQEGDVKAMGDCVFTRMVQKFHLHSISVHFPNGILPAVSLFLLLSFLLKDKSLDSAAFYCLIFTLINMPLVILSGVVEWRRRYGAAKTSVFIIKAICAVFVLTGITSLIVWKFLQPDVLSSGQGAIFVLISFIVLGAAGVAGHLGGGLIFASRK